MIPNVDEKLVASLVAWARRGATPNERDAREREVAEALLGGGVEGEEREQIERWIVDAERAADAGDVVKATAPVLPPPAPTVKPIRVYSPARRGHMRAIREEGIGDELARMKEEATGSPFFGGGGDEPAVKAPAPAITTLIDKLKNRRIP